jgi:hypothetical protein
MGRAEEGERRISLRINNFAAQKKGRTPHCRKHPGFLGVQTAIMGMNESANRMALPK